MRAPVLSGGVYLRVDHSAMPHGSPLTAFRLERRKAGAWILAKRYRAVAGGVRQFPVRAGVYRVRGVQGKSQRVSRAYRYTPRPKVAFASGTYLEVDIDPDLPGRKSWPLTLQRKESGRWVEVEETRSAGPRETLHLDQADGTYRVVTRAQGRFPRSVSQPFDHRRSRDLSPPDAVRDLSADVLESSVHLNWLNPTDADLAEIVVRRAEGGDAQPQ